MHNTWRTSFLSLMKQHPASLSIRLQVRVSFTDVMTSDTATDTWGPLDISAPRIARHHLSPFLTDNITEISTETKQYKTKGKHDSKTFTLLNLNTP